MENENKIQSMSDLSSMFSEMENMLQNNIEQNKKVANTDYHDDYEDFTEFEDENGKIMLIKYSDVEYEFRGNRYCKYILCDEKTGSRENGVAQIKNGQKVHIKEVERVNKIKEFMNAERSRKIDYYTNLHSCTLCEEIKGRERNIEYDVKVIGYDEGSKRNSNTFNDTITVLYKILDNDDFGFIQIIGTYGSNSINKYCVDYDTAREIIQSSNFIKLAQVNNAQYTIPHQNDTQTVNISSHKNNILSGIAKFFRR